MKEPKGFNEWARDELKEDFGNTTPPKVVIYAYERYLIKHYREQEQIRNRGIEYAAFWIVVAVILIALLAT